MFLTSEYPCKKMNLNEQQDFIHCLFLAVNQTLFYKQFNPTTYFNHCKVTIQKVKSFFKYQIEISSFDEWTPKITQYYLHEHVLNHVLKSNKFKLAFHDIKFCF